ncbi:MAG: PfkB family carbohydrate kinase [Ferruginibacter sp.]
MKHHVVCIGAMLVDELFYCKEAVVAATSNPAIVKRTAGGVMRNIAHHLALLDIPVQFITVTGNDSDGRWLNEDCVRAGIDMSATITANCSTGKYSAILGPDGSLYAAACVNPSESFITTDLLKERDAVLSSATIIVADTNLDANVLEWLIEYCKERSILLFIEPVSVAKARKLSSIVLNGLFMVTPNEDELPSLSLNNSTAETILHELITKGVKHVWLRKGANGSEIITSQNRYSLPSPKTIVKDITGAGDSALAAWIAAYCLGKNEKQCLLAAHAMAAAIIKIEGAVDTSIDQKKLFDSIKTYYPDEQ